MKPKVSVVVIAYNEEKKLPFCLDSLVNLDYPKDRLEIIVVDNNSTDRTKQVIKNYPVRYIFEETKGRGRARNKGVEASRGELIAFIDADCVADKAWLKNIVKGFTSEQIAGCGGKTLPYRVQTLAEKYLDFLGGGSNEETIAGRHLFPFIITTNAIYKRRALEEIGGFDDYFITVEDTDLSWRLVLQGYQLKYVSGAIVYHRYCKTIGALLRQAFEHVVWFFKLVTKYEDILGVRVKFLPLPWRVAKTAFKGPRGAVEVEEARASKGVYPIHFVVVVVKMSGVIYSWFGLKLKGRKFETLSSFRKVVWWVDGDKMVIVKLDNESYQRFYLQGAGARVWRLLAERKELEEVAKVILKEYELEENKAKAGIAALASRFDERGLLDCCGM